MSTVDILGPVLGFLGDALAVGLGFLQAAEAGLTGRLHRAWENMPAT